MRGSIWGVGELIVGGDAGSRPPPELQEPQEEQPELPAQPPVVVDDTGVIMNDNGNDVIVDDGGHVMETNGAPVVVATERKINPWLLASGAAAAFLLLRE